MSKKRSQSELVHLKCCVNKCYKKIKGLSNLYKHIEVQHEDFINQNSNYKAIQKAHSDKQLSTLKIKVDSELKQIEVQNLNNDLFIKNPNNLITKSQSISKLEENMGSVKQSEKVFNWEQTINDCINNFEKLKRETELEYEEGLFVGHGMSFDAIEIEKIKEEQNPYKEIVNDYSKGREYRRYVRALEVVEENQTVCKETKEDKTGIALMFPIDEDITKTKRYIEYMKWRKEVLKEIGYDIEKNDWIKNLIS